MFRSGLIDTFRLLGVVAVLSEREGSEDRESDSASPAKRDSDLSRDTPQTETNESSSPMSCVHRVWSAAKRSSSWAVSPDRSSAPFRSSSRPSDQTVGGNRRLELKMRSRNGGRGFMLKDSASLSVSLSISLVGLRWRHTEGCERCRERRDAQWRIFFALTPQRLTSGVRPTLRKKERERER